MLSWNQVRDELVEAVALSRRMPGAMPRSSGGFATDGPWKWLTVKARVESDFAAWAQEVEAQAIRDLRNRARDVPLSAEQVTWMESRIEWLGLVADGDRKLVWLALVQLAGGARGGSVGEDRRATGSVDWSKVRRWLPVEIGRKGLYRRFVRALQALAERLNADETRRDA